MKRLLAALMVAALVLPVYPGSAPEPAYAAYTPPSVKVALVRSTDSQAWVDKYNRGYGILLKEDVLFDYLTSRGWDVTRISDDDLESLAKLKQYDVVVCMWVFAMSPSAANNLVKYVGDGGGLVVPYASPRVAPGVGGTELSDHWLRIMNYEGWEWGPPSEVYQTFFIDDVGAFKYVARPAWGDPIVSGTASILQARGLNAGDLNLWRNQNPGAWIEYVRPLTGNANTVQFMNLSQLSAPTGSKNYGISGGMGAAHSTYLKGRSVYFYFSPIDYIFNQDGSGEQTVDTGVKQREIAGAYVESAIAWAASSGGRPGVLVRDGRTYATLNVYRDGIYASHYVTNLGNVSVTGTLSFRIYDPAGRLVKSSARYKIGVEPGKTHRYSETYKPGSLAAGTYRVEAEYLTTYPAYERRYVETAYVYRAQGEGIRTNRDTAKTTGQVVYDPRIVRSAGSDRYNTSLAIADAAGGYPRAERTVIIASGSGPDALVGSSIAGAYDAPLILTDVAALPAATDSWLRSTARGFDKAIIIGGEAAVSGTVENRLKQIFGDADVTRLAGEDRYQTSAEVARAVKAKLGTAYDGGMIVAYGYALVDAAGASAIAAGRSWPIIYTDRSYMYPLTSDVVSELASGTVSPQAWIAGDSGVVGQGVEDGIEALGVDVKRAAGADRYETAVRLADLAVSSGSNYRLTGMASGIKLADALCLGSYIGRSDGVMLLTNGNSLSVPTANRIKDNKSRIVTVSVGGGYMVVSHDLCASISNLLP